MILNTNNTFFSFSKSDFSDSSFSLAWEILYKAQQQNKTKQDFLVQGFASSYPETTKAIDSVGGELWGNMIYG